MIPQMRALFILLALIVCVNAVAELPHERQAQLLYLLKHDCGSCHGLTLQGGLGPALTPTALAEKPAEFLRAVILEGRPGTPMPPWRPFLREAEAAWLVDVLKKGTLDVR